MTDDHVPDARVRLSNAETPLSEAEVKGMLVNPAYVLGGMVDERTFAAVAQKLVSENGTEDYLRNLLFTMMRSLTPHIDPHEAIPDESQWLEWANALVTDHGVEKAVGLILADLKSKYGRYFG